MNGWLGGRMDVEERKKEIGGQEIDVELDRRTMI